MGTVTQARGVGAGAGVGGAGVGDAGGKAVVMVMTATMRRLVHPMAPRRAPGCPVVALPRPLVPFAPCPPERRRPWAGPQSSSSPAHDGTAGWTKKTTLVPQTRGWGWGQTVPPQHRTRDLMLLGCTYSCAAHHAAAAPSRTLPPPCRPAGPQPHSPPPPRPHGRYMPAAPRAAAAHLELLLQVRQAAPWRQRVGRHQRPELGRL